MHGTCTSRNARRRVAPPRARPPGAGGPRARAGRAVARKQVPEDLAQVRVVRLVVEAQAAAVLEVRGELGREVLAQQLGWRGHLLLADLLVLLLLGGRLEPLRRARVPMGFRSRVQQCAVPPLLVAARALSLRRETAYLPVAHMQTDSQAHWPCTVRGGWAASRHHPAASRVDRAALFDAAALAAGHRLGPRARACQGSEPRRKYMST